MLEVSVDPFLVANVQPNNRESLRRFVDELADWASLANCRWSRLSMTEMACPALAEFGIYPSLGFLRTAFRDAGLVEYDAETVALMVDAMLRLPSCESISRIRDVAWDGYSGAFPGDIAPVGLQSAARRTAVLWALLEVPNARKYVAVSELHTAPAVSITRATSVIVDSFDSEEIAYFDEVRVDLLTPSRCRDFLARLDPCELIERVTAETIRYGVTLRISQLDNFVRLPWESPSKFALAGTFVKDCAGLHIVDRATLCRKILFACANIATGRNTAASHFLRQNQHGSSPQITRGLHRAFRYSIDDEYRIHYWRGEDGAITFANVCAHQVFDIAAPD